MVKLFNRAVNEIVDPDAPVDNLPNVTGEYPGSIGDDINLPLLVREVGNRKKAKLEARKKEIGQELAKIDMELHQLAILLNAVAQL